MSKKITENFYASVINWKWWCFCDIVDSLLTVGSGLEKNNIRVACYEWKYTKQTKLNCSRDVCGTKVIWRFVYLVFSIVNTVLLSISISIPMKSSPLENRIKVCTGFEFIWIISSTVCKFCSTFTCQNSMGFYKIAVNRFL